MKRELTEEPLILITIIKWSILATLAGIIGGFAAVLFLKTLDFGIKWVHSIPHYYYFLPFGLFISSFLVKHLAGNQDLSTEKVIEDIHKRQGRIKLLTIPAAFLSTLFTIVFGGSAGKEAPSADISAGLASGIARIFRFNTRDTRRFVICGISAGFSAVFGVPIAGAIFSVEVLYVGNMLYTVLFPAFVSGIIGYEVANYFGIAYFHKNFVFSVASMPQHMFIKSLLFGVIFGLVALLLVLVLKWVKILRQKIKIPAPYHSFIGGAIILGIALVFSDWYLGMGLKETEQILQGYTEVVWYAFIIKILVTAFTLNFGGRGGLITPIFFIGATSGVVLARVFNMDPVLGAAMGSVAVLGAAANTPIAASLLAMELYSPVFATYFALSIVAAYVTIGHNSIYPTQVLLFSKAENIYVETRKGLDEQKKVRYLMQSRGLVAFLLSFFLKNKVFDKKQKKYIKKEEV